MQLAYPPLLVKFTEASAYRFAKVAYTSTAIRAQRHYCSIIACKAAEHTEEAAAAIVADQFIAIAFLN